MIEKAPGEVQTTSPSRAGAKPWSPSWEEIWTCSIPIRERPWPRWKPRRCASCRGQREAIAGAPDIPTLRELGINASFQQVRSIAAPKDLPPDTVRFYEDLFPQAGRVQVVEGEIHRGEYADLDYKNSAETMKLWDANNEFCARTMKEMGVIK